MGLDLNTWASTIIPSHPTFANAGSWQVPTLYSLKLLWRSSSAPFILVSNVLTAGTVVRCDFMNLYEESVVGFARFLMNR